MHTVECLKDTPPSPDPSSTHMGIPPKCKCPHATILPSIKGGGGLDLAHYRVPPLVPLPS